MKLSDYNIFVPFHKGHTILYNSISGYYALIKPDSFTLIQRHQNDIVGLRQANNRIYNSLVNNGCIIEQNLNEFELHLRAVLGLPIPGIKQERIGASAVILSPIASQERPQYRGLEEVTKEEDTYLRIFGKPFTRVNRRMGVVLCYAPLDSDLDALRDKAKRIAEKVEVH